MMRAPMNVRDLACWQTLKDQGFIPSRRGWPHMIGWQSGRVIFVVIRRGRAMRPAHKKIADTLAGAGLEVYEFVAGQLIKYNQGGDHAE